MAIASTLRSRTRGLARIGAPTNSFLGYSAAPGALATDDSGPNSAFALALNGQL